MRAEEAGAGSGTVVDVDNDNDDDDDVVVVAVFPGGAVAAAVAVVVLRNRGGWLSRHVGRLAVRGCWDGPVPFAAAATVRS